MNKIIKILIFVILSLLLLGIFKEGGVPVLLGAIAVYILSKVMLPKKKTPPIVDEYWIKDGEGKVGPFTVDDLKRKNISESTLILNERFSSYTPAKEIEELKPLFVIPVKKTEDKRVTKDEEIQELNLKSGNKYWIKAGLIFSIFGGLIGLIFGINYTFGNYKKDTKQTGIIILVISVVMSIVWISSLRNYFHNQDNGIVRIDTKEFADRHISKKTITIQEFEKNISNDSYYHRLLLNKAVRFKMFFDAEDYTTKLFANNCDNLGKEITLAHKLYKTKFEEGIDNSDYLFKIASKKEIDFQQKYNSILDEQTKEISHLFTYSDENCNNVLSEIKKRYNGLFFDNEQIKNVISFNSITAPEKEVDNFYQLFSSFKNAPDEDFFFTLKIPFSWKGESKSNFNKKSTIGSFQPNDKFLNAHITISILSETSFSEESIEKEGLTDKELIKFLYEDDGFMSECFNVKNKPEFTFFDYGNVSYILCFNEVYAKDFMDNSILEGKKMKMLQALTVKKGKLISITCGTSDELDSYDYYSKLFYKVLTSIKFKDVKNNTIYLKEQQNMKYIDIAFENLDYEFLLDTGASGIVINKSILQDFLNNGIITRSDYKGRAFFEIANGDTILAEQWNIPSMKVGNKTVYNVVVSVMDSENSTPLFGMEGLNKLNVSKLNLNENEIILKD